MKVWAYIHPQLNILCCALLPNEAVPPNVEVVELEVESPDDVYMKRANPSEDRSRKA
jgi:hypothetical protein